MREWNTAFELYVIAPCGRCTSEAVIYSAAGQAAEVGRSVPVDLHPDVGLVQRERDLPFGDFDFFMTSGPPWARVSPEIL